MRPSVIGLVALLVGAAAAGCTGAASSPTTAPTTSPSAMATACQPGGGMTQTVHTTSYVMVLDLGPTEAMYTADQVAAQHPTTGEVMVSGQMAGMSAPAASAPGMSEPAMSEPAMSASGAMATAMASGSSMAMESPAMAASGAVAADQRHLEIHICSQTDGSVVQNAQPTITVVDETAKGMTVQVPVAVMEGIGMGTADLHYGNNVQMPPGHTYTVTVQLNGETATFHLSQTS